MLVNIPKIIEQSNPRRFCGEIIQQLTKRDNDDFTRLTARVGEIGMIRYFAARYMDPMFVGGAEERAFKRFGQAIESAYQDLIGDLEAADAEKKARRDEHPARIRA